MCHDSNESSSLIHMFFSERKALKIPDISKDTKILPITSAAVIGCGTMGGGIAMSFANVGIPVTVIESSQEALDKGIKIIEKNYANTVSKGRMSPNELKKRMSLINASTDLESISEADIVIEAVFEEMTSGALPYCDSDERWQKETKFAVMKKGRARAIRLHSSKEEATEQVEYLGKDHYIEDRVGEATRCTQNWCGVADWCDQYQQSNETKGDLS